MENAYVTGFFNQSIYGAEEYEEETQKRQNALLEEFLKPDAELIREENEKELQKLGLRLDETEKTDVLEYGEEHYRIGAEEKLFENMRIGMLKGGDSDILKDRMIRLKSGRAQSLIESVGEERRAAAGDIKVEMINNMSSTGEVDMEKTLDMLTGRICEIMAKSSDGFYM